MTSTQWLADLIQEVTGQKKLTLHAPSLGVEEAENLAACVRENFVSSVGRFVDDFEKQLQEFTGCGKAVAVSSGTTALHAALYLAGIGPSDEVLVPDLTFVGTANAVLHCGATPHFVEIDETTLGIDAQALENYLHALCEVRNATCFNKKSGRPIKALMPMHTFGFMSDMPKLLEVAKKFKILVVEDAAEALGSYLDGKHAGTLADIGTLSFNGNKIVTTGGGGALLYRDPVLGARAKHITTTAKKAHPYLFEHTELGFNYRMPNINAALGCAQMKKLPKFLDAKRSLAERYKEAFSGNPHGRLYTERPGTRANYWLNTFLLNKESSQMRDALIAGTNERGVHVRPAWNLMHTLPYLKDCPRMPAPKAEDLAARIISLPSSAFL